MNCKGLIIMLLWAAMMALPTTLCAQQNTTDKTEQTAEEKARIAEQRKLIEQLEKQVEEDSAAESGTASWFEQVTSKHKVSSNATSPPCDAEAQTVRFGMVSSSRAVRCGNFFDDVR
mgnify:CR=1 FL=1